MFNRSVKTLRVFKIKAASLNALFRVWGNGVYSRVLVCFDAWAIFHSNFPREFTENIQFKSPKDARTRPGEAEDSFSRACIGWYFLGCADRSSMSKILLKRAIMGKEVEVGELLMKNGMQCWKIKVLKWQFERRWWIPWAKYWNWQSQQKQLPQYLENRPNLGFWSVLVCLCCGLSLPHSLKRWAVVRTLGIFAALLQASAMCVDSWLSSFLRISHWAHEGPGFANAWTLVQTRSTKWVQWYGNPGGLSTCWWTNLRSTHQRWLSLWAIILLQQMGESLALKNGRLTSSWSAQTKVRQALMIYRHSLWMSFRWATLLHWVLGETG